MAAQGGRVRAPDAVIRLRKWLECAERSEFAVLCCCHMIACGVRTRPARQVDLGGRPAGAGIGNQSGSRGAVGARTGCEALILRAVVVWSSSPSCPPVEDSTKQNEAASAPEHLELEEQRIGVARWRDDRDSHSEQCE